MREMLRRPSFWAAMLVLGLLLWPLVSEVDLGGSDDPDSAAVRDARALLVEVDTAQLCSWKRHGRYSANLADLQSAGDGGREPGSTEIVGRLARSGLDLDLIVGRDGRTYIQRVTGRGVDTYVERRGSDFTDHGELAWPHLRSRCPAEAR